MRGPAGLRLDGTPSVPVVAKAVWHVMQRRDTPQFGRVLDFLEGIHEQVPELLCYRHYAKLSAGLRGKMVLNMVEQRCPLMDILKALNCHFPPACPDDPSTVNPDLFRVRQCHLHFRKFVLRMIRDEKFRRSYVEKKLPNEYGETFMAVLEKLLWEFLCRLQTVLTPLSDQVTVLD
ncbi:hypothetical protein FKM82_003752 [Ascaphus truei]